jgi:DNA polymerase-3 subunit delta'
MFSLIGGNKKIIDSLERAIEKKSLAQSYLFCGPEAVGKFLTAKKFAEKLTGQKNEAVNSNLLIIEPEVEEKDGVFKEKAIKLEAIKHLQKEFSLTAFSKSYRVAIIRSAQALNLSAQNALLKILEEPPENTIIILVAEDVQELLPTIVSRCQIKQFSLLLETELGEMFDASLPNREEIIFWSLGRPGLLQILLQSEIKLEEKRAIAKEFQLLFSMIGNDRLFLAESLSKNTPVLLEKFNFWIILLRSGLLNQKSFVNILPEKALELIEKIEDSKKIIENTNSNVRLVVENLLLAF